MLIVLVLAALATAASSEQASPDEARQAAFLTESHRAMERMMSAMHVAASGNIDRDFAAMMIPHHQGAIDMAVAELRFGQNPVLRRMAQEIVVTQRQEIAVMQRQLDSLLSPDHSSVSQVVDHTSEHKHGGHP